MYLMEVDSTTRSSGHHNEETRGADKMEDDGSKHSPDLDLNQAVASENEEEGESELAQDQAQQLWREEIGVAEEADRVAPEEAIRVSEEKFAPDEDRVSASEEKLPSPAGDGSRSPPSPPGNRSLSPENVKTASASPADVNNKASPPMKRDSKTPSPRSKGSPVTAWRNRSPSPRRKRSPASGRRSLSRSPDGRDGRRFMSRSPDGGHGSGRDERKRRHDRSRSPVGRYGTRERHGRSRSRSSYEQDYSRSRYSPRRRPSPPRYQSRRDRSPRRHPWSPPSYRNTGVGKPGRNLFVAGFSFVITERDLEKKFSRYGRVTDVRIIRDRRSGDSRGFGFLSLERDEDADAAIKALDQTEWNGRIVLVEKAKAN